MGQCITQSIMILGLCDACAIGHCHCRAVFCSSHTHTQHRPQADPRSGHSQHGHIMVTRSHHIMVTP
jgi:hypothetical protein